MKQDTEETYPWTIEHTSNALILALSDTEVGKIQIPHKITWVNAITNEPLPSPFKEPTIEDEMLTLIYANQVNDLMPRFIRVQDWELFEGQTHKMLVMERIYPLPIHHYELSVRLKMIEEFEQKMEELHDNKFVHGDLKRPTTPLNRGDQEWMYKNIVQTKQGLRLLDSGFSLIRNTENIREFVVNMMGEQADMEYFRHYYLGAKI
jgi:serine/threonine protein kinase